MKIEKHFENLNESVREINESVIKGLTEKQRTIGFHASAGAVDLLEILLHKHRLISSGFQIKHDWFNSTNKVADKFDFEFPRKKEILELMINIESVRNRLCYGGKQPEFVIEKVINDFNKLKEIFKEETKYEL